jgi:hypothetical protein
MSKAKRARVVQRGDVMRRVYIYVISFQREFQILPSRF